MTGNGAIPSPSHQSAHARGRDSLSLCLPAPCNTPRASATALDSLSDTGRLSPGGACTDTAADRPVPFPQRDIVIYTRRRHVLPHCTNPSVQYAGYSSLLHTYTTRGVPRLLGTAPLGVCLFLLSACSPARIRPRIRVAHAHKRAQGPLSKARKGKERRRGGAWSEGERRHARRTAVSQGPASTFDGFPVGRACECLLVPPSAKYIRVQWRAVRRALCAVPWPPTVRCAVAAHRACASRGCRSGGPAALCGVPCAVLRLCPCPWQGRISHWACGRRSHAPLHERSTMHGNDGAGRAASMRGAARMLQRACVWCFATPLYTQLRIDAMRGRRVVKGAVPVLRVAAPYSIPRTCACACTCPPHPLA